MQREWLAAGHERDLANANTSLELPLPFFIYYKAAQTQQSCNLSHFYWKTIRCMIQLMHSLVMSGGLALT